MTDRQPNNVGAHDYLMRKEQDRRHRMAAVSGVVLAATAIFTLVVLLITG
jgi:hypothetical protein